MEGIFTGSIAGYGGQRARSSNVSFDTAKTLLLSKVANVVEDIGHAFSFLSLCKIYSADGGGGPPSGDFCGKLKELYTALNSYSSPSYISQLTEWLKSEIIEFQNDISNAIEKFEAAQTASIITMIASAILTAGLIATTIATSGVTFACLIISWGIFITSAMNYANARHQIKKLEESRSHFDQLLEVLARIDEDIILGETSSFGGYAKKVKVIGIKIGCTCF